MSRRPRCTVGLTGGLASGKSTVARRLAAHGLPVLDADAVVADLYRPGAAGAAALAAALGPGVLDATGAVDRAALAARIAADAGVLATVNRTVHPLVRAEIATWLATVAGDIAVVEAALLVETGSYRDYDLLLVVVCGRALQAARATARGMPAERVATLLAAQSDDATRTALADRVMVNAGSLAELEGEVERTVAWLGERCRASYSPAR